MIMVDLFRKMLDVSWNRSFMELIYVSFIASNGLKRLVGKSIMEFAGFLKVVFIRLIMYENVINLVS